MAKRKATTTKKKSTTPPRDLEGEFLRLLSTVDTSLAESVVREHRFHPKRKWPFDFAWLDLMVAVEIEGGHWHGRHTRGKGFVDDCEKYNAATALGWRVLRFTSVDLDKRSRIITPLVATIRLARRQQRHGEAAAGRT